MATPESRCVVCDQPCADHVALRYWWAVWWRHHTFPAVGWILGRLPPLTGHRG